MIVWNSSEDQQVNKRPSKLVCTIFVEIQNTKMKARPGDATKHGMEVGYVVLRRRNWTHCLLAVLCAICQEPSLIRPLSQNPTQCEGLMLKWYGWKVAVVSCRTGGCFAACDSIVRRSYFLQDQINQEFSDIQEIRCACSADRVCLHSLPGGHHREIPKEVSSRCFHVGKLCIVLSQYQSLGGWQMMADGRWKRSRSQRFGPIRSSSAEQYVLIFRSLASHVRISM